MKLKPSTPGLGKLILSCALAASASAALVACGGDDDAPVTPVAEPPATTTGAVVTTKSGPVRGAETTASWSYLGIPYAAPPTGNLRWRAPQAAAAWTAERDGTKFAAHCAQPLSFFGAAATSEDCLNLNVFVPKTKGPHPVLVWIHGGAFIYGQSDNYIPTALVGQDVVVVTLNYRLGALGFLAHAALSAEQGGKSGNYGLMDQQAALRWVQDNIGRFAGDKNNVTIMGESAGGFSVNAHLASAASAGLFHKAISMSGAYPFAAGQPTLAAAQTVGAGIVDGTTCKGTPTVECLRALPVAALLTAQAKPLLMQTGTTPNIDGVVLTEQVKTTFTNKTQNKVPVLQGSTRDEWRLFVAQTELVTGQPLNATTYVPTLKAQLGDAAEALVPFYPVAATPDGYSLALGAMGTDVVFACTSRSAARLLADGGKPVFTYEFNDPNAPPTLPAPVSFNTGAAHSSELQYLFSIPGAKALSTTQQTLSAAMVGYWARFARNGDPSGGTAPAWAPYSKATDQYQNLIPGTIAPLTTFAADHKCVGG